MAIDSARIDEMTAKFAELNDEDFEEWLSKQPDFEELAATLIDLFRTAPKTDPRADGTNPTEYTNKDAT